MGTEGRDITVHYRLATPTTARRKHGIVVLTAVGLVIPLVEPTVAKRLATLSTDETLGMPCLTQGCLTGLRGEGRERQVRCANGVRII